MQLGVRFPVGLAESIFNLLKVDRQAPPKGIKLTSGFADNGLAMGMCADFCKVGYPVRLRTGPPN